MSTEWWCDLAG